MASCLVQMGDGSVTLPGAAVRALLQKGDGDAALLYLALLRHSGAVPPRSLAGELRWERERIEQAERALREMKLIAPTAEELPAPAEEKPDYTAEEITDQLEHSAGFRELTAQVERRLGKKLSTPDVSALLGLYDYMPPHLQKTAPSANAVIPFGVVYAEKGQGFQADEKTA